MVQHGVLAKNGSMKQTHFSCQRELQSIAECQSIHLSKQTILKFYPCGIRACATPTPVCSKRRGHASIPRMPRIVDKHTPLPLCTRLSEKAEWQEWELRVDALTCEYACLPPPLHSTNTHTHTHPCHTHTEQMWNWYSASPDRYALYFTDSALMHHSVKPRVGTSLVVNPSLPSLSLYTCIIPHSVHEEGLFSFVRVWPCHVCAGSRRTASTRAELWMFRVTPRWHADIYHATAAFVPLSSAWQRTYRSPKKIPEQYQFAQPAHSEWRIRCTQVGHIHTHMQAHADLQRIAVECTSKGDRNTHTHTHTEWAKDPTLKLAGVIIPSEGKWLKITEGDICADRPVI